jgi:hypothetical protein
MLSRRASGGDRGGGAEAPPSVHRTLAEPGRPLETTLRRDMEGRFGRDFSQVRIHQDAGAGQSARDVGASAYTVGNAIVFGPGRSPRDSGGRLLAHELAHVIQQQDPAPQVGVRQPVGRAGSDTSPSSPILMRQGDGIIGSALDKIEELKQSVEKKAEKTALAYLGAIASVPGLGAVYTNPDRNCPPTFCNPFRSKVEALEYFAIAAPLLREGIKRKVGSRVVPFWTLYLAGGTSVIDISGAYGPDFTNSRTTKKTAEYLYGVLKSEIGKYAKSLMGGAQTIRPVFGTGNSVNTKELTKAFSAISDQDSGHAMNFNYPFEVPGNIAGGIGKDQASIKIGAKPSAWNDMRNAEIACELTRTPTGILATPSIGFTVVDTVDLCPGDCGDESKGEWAGTIPLSRFEATGLVGDVPYRVEFPAPAGVAPPFEVPLPAGMPPVTEAKPSPVTETKKDLPEKNGR